MHGGIGRLRRTAVTRESSALGQRLRGTCVLAYLSRGVHLSTRSRGGLNIWLANARKSWGNRLSPPLHLYARAVYDETTERTCGDVIVSSRFKQALPTRDVNRRGVCTCEAGLSRSNGDSLIQARFISLHCDRHINDSAIEKATQKTLYAGVDGYRSSGKHILLDSSHEKMRHWAPWQQRRCSRSGTPL